MHSLSPPRLPELGPGERLVPAVTVIAVVDALPGRPIVPALLAHLGARAARLRMLLRHRPGFDLIEGGAATHPDALREASAALLASATHAVLVTEGPPLLAALSPRLAILGTPSPSLLSLDPDVRSLRDRFDLVLHDFRPRVIESVADGLAS